MNGRVSMSDEVQQPTTSADPFAALPTRRLSEDRMARRAERGDNHVESANPGRDATAGPSSAVESADAAVARNRPDLFTELQHVPDNFSVVDDLLPATLSEPLRYMLNRRLVADPGALPVRLGVVSALHGEGVTTISRTLASLMANDLNANVCWIDLSWARARPRRDPKSTTKRKAGIVDVLAGSATLNDALVVTEDARLNILNAGNTSLAHAGRYARSPLLPSIVDQLEERFDRIVIDMPAVLAGSECLGLMRLVDAYLLVVRYGVTTTQQVRSATDELTSIPSAGVVMNQFKSKIPRRLSHFFA